MFWRLSCHACGRKSQYSKGSGITQFQCPDCQAWTYLDRHGEYTDPPAEAVAREQTFNHRGRQDVAAFAPSQQHVFCDTCLHNQNIYHQLLSEYLPDEDHHLYNKYLRELPQYKRALERRYPQICQECAPKAQSLIHNADYFSMTNNASRLLGRSRGGRRSMSPEPHAVQSRDTVHKSLARTALRLAGVIVNCSALFQVLWHIYGTIMLQQEFGKHGRIFDEGYYEMHMTEIPRTSQCLERINRKHFDYPCFTHGSTYMPAVLFVSTLLVWYNPGLRQLYNPSIRIANVIGWRLHLAFMLVVLTARWLAYFYLADRVDIHIQTLRGVHIVAAAIIVLGHLLARRSIELEKWRVNGSIMPRPEERDVLSQYAGPAKESFTPQTSLTTPAQLLAREPQSFPIQNLAPRRRMPSSTQRVQLPPSPPGSEGDPMDIEPIPPAQQAVSSSSAFGRSTGWDSVRTNIFSIDDEMRARQQRGPSNGDDKHMYIRPAQPQANPFRARLPQAPMSQERKMRNPISQVPQFKEMPPSQRQDFLQQMRDGVDKGRGFFRRESVDSDVSELQAASSRTRGQLDLAQSDWHLPSDVNKSTGLEDIFGGSSFKIQDHNEAPPLQTSATPTSTWQRRNIQVALSLALLLVLAFDMGGLRRSVCLYFVGILEDMGY